MLLIPVPQRILLVILFLEIRLLVRSLKPYVRFLRQLKPSSLILAAGLSGSPVLFPGSSGLKKTSKSRRMIPDPFLQHLPSYIVLFNNGHLRLRR